jgi:hypothetical protein
MEQEKAWWRTEEAEALKGPVLWRPLRPRTGATEGKRPGAAEAQAHRWLRGAACWARPERPEQGISEHSTPDGRFDTRLLRAKSTFVSTTHAAHARVPRLYIHMQHAASTMPSTYGALKYTVISASGRNTSSTLSRPARSFAPNMGSDQKQHQIQTTSNPHHTKTETEMPTSYSL